MRIFLHLLQDRVQLVKTADEEISNQAVEIARVVFKQYANPVVQSLAGLVRQKSQIRRHWTDRMRNDRVYLC